MFDGLDEQCDGFDHAALNRSQTTALELVCAPNLLRVFFVQNNKHDKSYQQAMVCKVVRIINELRL